MTGLLLNIEVILKGKSRIYMPHSTNMATFQHQNT